MAGIKISQLPAASAAAGTDELETNQSGTSRKLSVDQIKSYALADYSGAESISTVGTVASGTWEADVIGVSYGGTGVQGAVSGLLKGDGAAYAAAVAGSDYYNTDSILDGGNF